MNIKSDWEKVRKHFNKSFRTNFHVSIASINTENNPTVTPIGSLFLKANQKGIYFEKYPTKLPANSETNNNICVLTVNSWKWFWIKSLFKGKFKYNPSIKLYGNLGEKRKATQPEKRALSKRMRVTKGMKGNKYLWGDMEYVREISFHTAEKVNLGDMTKDL